MPVRKTVLDQLSAYLEPGGPNAEGEWGMRCPLHDDRKRSASLNVESGLWYCQACELGGKVTELIKEMKLEEGSRQRAEKKEDRGEFPYTDNHVRAWQAALFSDPSVMADFEKRRGIAPETLVEFEIGWDARNRAYTIPVRDVNGELVNIRWYQLDPPDDRRKIWGVTGWNSPTLFPIDSLAEADQVIICEGEWDAILATQHGFTAITRTGAGNVWNDAWNEEFRNLVVYVCQDRDETGQVGTRKIMRALKDVAAAVYEVVLPYELTDKHGKDITDFFWEDGHTAEDFQALLDSAAQLAPQEIDYVSDVRVIDSFNSDRYGQRMRMRVTVTGKRNPPYMVPQDVEFTCTMDAGAKCKGCSMSTVGGYMQRSISPMDPLMLSMLDAGHDQLMNLMRGQFDIVKCHRMLMDVQRHTTVEELYVRPSMDVQLGTKDAGDYTTRRLFSIGRHDTAANSTVEAIGGIFPNPKTQKNEFLAWQCQKTDTDIDKFEMTPELKARLEIFRPDDDQPVLRKLEEIADDLTANVTKIYGRLNMHTFVDLIFHSVLSFSFMGSFLYRGWLDGMIVGDTRTGKSEVADKLRQHYGVGEMISCESSTFAGVVGGLSQLANNAWEVTWGSIPLNDRRIVIMDEVSGLTPENIAQMSSIRSSGEAQLTKIRSEKTFARTRLLWLGNPRNAKMTDFTYGVQAIRPLVGNNEDVARFDMAMAVQSGEVASEDINSMVHQDVPHIYTSDLCNHLVLWAWSRTADQVKWANGAEKRILDLAIKLGDGFCEDPPLVQAANIRIKLARLAVAIAARVFSTDRTGQCVLVTRSHAEAAYDFLKSIYGNAHFGYSDVSREQMLDEMMAREHVDEVRNFLDTAPMFAKFLRSSAKFKRGDAEEVLNMGRDEIGAIMNFLWERRMLRRDGPYIKCTSTLQELLREVAP